MRIVAAGFLAICLVAVRCEAVCHTGCCICHYLVYDPYHSNDNWVAPPPSFTITEDGSARTALDWCLEINGRPGDASRVAEIRAYDPWTARWVSKACADPVDEGFALSPGEGYALVASRPGAAIALPGHYDGAFTSENPYALAYAGPGTLNLVAVPPDSVAETALDLCVEINGAPGDDSQVVAVVDWDAKAEELRTKLCNDPFSTGFPLVAFKSYGLVPCKPDVALALRVYAP
jgi:hypothetical protein